MQKCNVKEFLDSQGIDYEIILHRPANTAQGTASASHIAASALAKTVIAKINGMLVMVVVPASQRVDLEMLKAATGAHAVVLASEAEFRDSFPECEIGAMPPFGNLYGMPVLVDHSVAENAQIVFNGGSHSELVRLAYKDFAAMVAPRVAALTARSLRQKAA